MKKLILIFIIGLFLNPLFSQEEEKPESAAATLDELLELVKQGRFAESEEASEREDRFRTERNRQQKLLSDAKAERARLERIAEELEAQFEANDAKLVVLEEQLKERLGSLYEMFGHLQSTASDSLARFEESITAAQFGKDREVFLSDLAKKMSEGVSLASIPELERLWFELLRELEASGSVEKFNATVVDNNGNATEEDVVRVGTFNAVAEGSYLSYLKTRGAYEVLPRQPARYTGGTYDLFDESSGFVQFGVAPTGPQGGTLLSNLITLPTFSEKIAQGRFVGYLILVLLAISAAVFIWRFYILYGVRRGVNAEAAGKGSGNNALSRVMKVAEEAKDADTETLELKMAEQILAERPAIEAYIWVVKLIAAVAPLLGLFGTIIGMINTFQAITLFGTGDPKTMASGISEALVTTWLGLMCAIPSVFMAAILANYSKGILSIIEEQSTGMVAARSEGKA